MTKVTSNPVHTTATGNPLHAGGLAGNGDDMSGETIDIEITSFEALEPQGAALLIATVFEQQLFDIRRERDRLRAENAELKYALTEAMQHSAEERRLAHHDALTGLPNRRLLMEHLRTELEAALQQRRQLALLFIDLNEFKAVNDRCGHATGDQLLSAVAARIMSCIRAGDVACRYGGDEFVVLLSNLINPTVAADIGAAICEHIGRRYTIDRQELRITASVGVAFYPADGEHCEALLRSADAFMYRNKPRRYAAS